MKRKIILFLGLILCFNTFAQKTLKKLSDRNYYIPVEYYQYPSNPLGENYKSIAKQITVPSQFMTNYVSTELDKIQGFRYVKVDEKPDLTVKVIVDHFNFDKVIINQTPNKDRDGKIVSYSADVKLPYTYEANGVLIDNLLHKNLYNEESRNMIEQDGYWGKHYDRLEDATDKTSGKYLEDLKYKIIEDVLRKFTASFTSTCKSKYGTSAVTQNALFIQLDEKNFFEHYFFLKQLDNLKRVMQKMTYNTPLLNYTNELQPIISYFESLDKKYENQMISPYISAMCYINLGQIYLYLDNPQKALFYANKAIAIHKSTFQTDNLLRNAKDLDFIMTKNNIKSRHKN